MNDSDEIRGADRRPGSGRREFLKTATGAMLAATTPVRAVERPMELPADHREMVQRRRRRIVVQQDVYDVLIAYARQHGALAPFAPFCDAVFAYVDEPGSQIDAIWWDISGNAVGSAFPSALAPWNPPNLVRHWHGDGIDWVERLVNETRRRKLEVFWNHRFSEVDLVPDGAHTSQADPLKAGHPEWVTRTAWWPQGMWNAAAPGLRAFKVALLRELTTRLDLDGLQIDFSRHVPCLPVGRQWKLRGEVTEFMQMVRVMLLEVAERRGRPMLLAAKVPETLEGCFIDGLDVKAWGEQRLVDILTLGSRTMDVKVEELRAVVGDAVQLQPCFDDHHATDGYRYGSSEFLRGVFANHLARGADSVVTFNWSVAPPAVLAGIGAEAGPQTHEIAFKEVGDPRTMAGKDKFFAVERRGGYPWAEGYFNRNDGAPLPARFAGEDKGREFALQISDGPAANANLILRWVFFRAEAEDQFEIRLNGVLLPITLRDEEWKDGQIFSPAPQRISGGKGEYKIDPGQRLLRLECAVPRGGWERGRNRCEVRVVRAAAAGERAAVQMEKLEAHLHYA
jgi:hypothetical protein